MSSRGLWLAPNLDTAPSKISEYGVECLGYQPLNDTLYGCQAYSFGKIDPANGTYTELFHFKSAKEFVACAGMEMAKTCEVQLCADYCAAGHFAQAQLCCAYRTDACGPAIAEMEGTGGPQMCGGTSVDAGVPNAGTGASTGASGSVAAGSGAPIATAGSTPAGPTAAGAPAGPPKRDSGGCSFAAAGRDDADRTASLWLSLLLVLGIALCSRRRR
jgi:hypothetical protein